MYAFVLVCAFVLTSMWFMYVCSFHVYSILNFFSILQLKVRPHDLHLCTVTRKGVDSTGQFQWADCVTLE